jgi:hypothetical protein
MRHLFVLSIVILFALPVAVIGQSCPEVPEITAPKGVLEGFNQLFINDVVLPLIEADAGNLGPKTWIMIAGQAYGESASKMHDEQYDYYYEKNGKNWWNVQLELNADGTCPEGSIAVTHGEGGTADKIGHMAKNCSPVYPTAEAAAIGYLDYAEVHFKGLFNVLQKPNLSQTEFVTALDKSRWASRDDRTKYQQEVHNSISTLTSTLRKMCKSQLGELAAAQSCLQSMLCIPDVVVTEKNLHPTQIDKQAVRDQMEQNRKRHQVLQKACLGAEAVSSNSKVATGTPLPEPQPCPEEPKQPAPELPPAPSGPEQRSGGGAHGDPHYYTADGMAYSTQLAGEFWLLKRDSAVAIQARHEPWEGSQSIASISALAFKLGTHRIGLYGGADHRVMVDGQRIALNADFQQINFEGGALGIWGEAGRPKTATVVWSDGSYALADWVGDWLVLRVSHAAKSTTKNDYGLLGSADNDAGNDLSLRDPAAISKFASIPVFVDSWRVQESESLFDYSIAQPYAFFQRLDFPQVQSEIAPSMLVNASRQCTSAGIINSVLASQCAFDLAASNDAGLLEHYRLAMLHLTQFNSVLTFYEPQNLPASASFKTIISPDKVGAKPLDSAQYHRILLRPGEARTFVLDIKTAQKPTAYPENMDCVGDYAGEGAGWQWFNAAGEAVSEARPSCADLVTDSDVQPGIYYLVVFARQGSVSVGLSFRLNMIE